MLSNLTILKNTSEMKEKHSFFFLPWRKFVQKLSFLLKGIEVFSRATLGWL